MDEQRGYKLPMMFMKKQINKKRISRKVTVFLIEDRELYDKFYKK